MNDARMRFATSDAKYLHQEEEVWDANINSIAVLSFWAHAFFSAQIQAFHGPSLQSTIPLEIGLEIKESRSPNS